MVRCLYITTGVLAVFTGVQSANAMGTANWLSISENPVIGSVLNLFKSQCRYLDPPYIGQEIRKKLSDPINGLVERELAISQITSLFNHHFIKPESLPLVVMLTGQAGTGKTYTAQLIRDAVFGTPDGNAGNRWGFAEFVSSDYMEDRFFEDIFVPKLLETQKRCGDNAPIMIFLDEILKLGDKPSAPKVAAVISDALKDGKISLAGSAHISVRKWVFIMATDINEQSQGGKKFLDFLYLNHNTDPSTQVYKTGLSHVMVELREDQQQYDLFTAFNLQRVISAGNLVVYPPYDKQQSERMMKAMIHGHLAKLGMSDVITISPQLLTLMKASLTFETLIISRDMCSGSSILSDPEEGSCAPFQIVQHGAFGVRNMVREYFEIPTNDQIQEMLEYELTKSKSSEIYLKSILHARTLQNVKFAKNIVFVAGLLPIPKKPREFWFVMCKILPIPTDERYEHSPKKVNQELMDRVTMDMRQCPEHDRSIYMGHQSFINP
eukprot:CFRG8245T1